MKKVIGIFLFIIIVFVLILAVRRHVIESYMVTPVENAFTSTSKKIGAQIEAEIPYLRFFGIGGSSNDGFIREKHISFLSSKKLEKEEGVRLISKIVNSYLKEVMSNKELKEYLKNYPFTYKNLRIGISVQEETRDPDSPSDIDIFDLQEGNIVYIKIVSSDPGKPSKHTFSEEPYEEALKRIEQN